MRERERVLSCGLPPEQRTSGKDQDRPVRERPVSQGRARAGGFLTGQES